MIFNQSRIRVPIFKQNRPRDISRKIDTSFFLGFVAKFKMNFQLLSK